MRNSIGKRLTFEEVKNLRNGTKVWVETNFPTPHVFLGTKQGRHIIDDDGHIRWAIARDFEVLCKAYEWRPKKGMDKLERLIGNIRILESQGMTECTFKTFIEEYPDLDSIDELNELMETEMSYWEG